jgi:hypothetical protein
MRRALALARVSGLLPSVLGLVFLAAYARNGSQSYEFLGIWLLLWGWTLVLLGFLCLRIYQAEAKEAGLPEAMVKRSSRWTWGLMLANVPVAAFCVVLGLRLNGSIFLRVYNHDSRCVDSILVLGPGLEQELGGLEPGGSRRHWLRVHGDGPLRMRAQGPGGAIEEQLEGYVTPGLQVRIQVWFEADGRTRIQVYDPD